MSELVVLLEGRVAGTVTAIGDRLRFTYDPDWRRAEDAYPLSLSMPLTAADHGHAPITAFIWNLLPDNDRTLERWAAQFHVSARNAFALIREVGEDCAGAVQFVRPERLEAMQAPRRANVRWLDERDIADRLRSVLHDAASGRTAADNGQFSLAGAQPKTALLHDTRTGRWGVPAGRTPTTHILKPSSADLPGHAENEHFCLTLANRLGMSAARSQVLHFDGVPAIVVERYDRAAIRPGPAGLVRLHQEDMCQAFGLPPSRKYQNEGGPDAAQIVRLIGSSVSQPSTAAGRIGSPAQVDVWRFVRALIFNWLIGGTDAHAKNYSLLIGSYGTVRLAPLYDLASAYGFAHIQPQRMKLAMKVDRYYPVESIVIRHWQRWATSAGLDPALVTEAIGAMTMALPEAIGATMAVMRLEGLTHPILDRLETRLVERAARIMLRL